MLSLVVLEPKQPKARRMDALRVLKKDTDCLWRRSNRLEGALPCMSLHINTPCVVVSPETRVPTLTASTTLP